MLSLTKSLVKVTKIVKLPLHNPFRARENTPFLWFHCAGTDYQDMAEPIGVFRFRHSLGKMGESTDLITKLFSQSAYIYARFETWWV